MLMEQEEQEEPEYIKLYLKDLMYLENLPSKHYQVVWVMLKYANYNKNEKQMIAYLNSTLKKEIANESNLTIKSLQNTLNQLVKGNILTRPDRGTYGFNPYFFGHGLGHWSDINKYRSEIDYSEISGTTYKVNLDKKKEVEHETE